MHTEADFGELKLVVRHQSDDDGEVGTDSSPVKTVRLRRGDGVVKVFVAAMMNDYQVIPLLRAKHNKRLLYILCVPVHDKREFKYDVCTFSKL